MQEAVGWIAGAAHVLERAGGRGERTLEFTAAEAPQTHAAQRLLEADVCRQVAAVAVGGWLEPRADSEGPAIVAERAQAQRNAVVGAGVGTHRALLDDLAREFVGCFEGLGWRAAAGVREQLTAAREWSSAGRAWDAGGGDRDADVEPRMVALEHLREGPEVVRERALKAAHRAGVVDHEEDIGELGLLRVMNLPQQRGLLGGRLHATRAAESEGDDR
jgi:hypothetical protein